MIFPHAKASDSKGKTLAAAAKNVRQQGYHGTPRCTKLWPMGLAAGLLYFPFPRAKEESGEGSALTRIAGDSGGAGHRACRETLSECRDDSPHWCFCAGMASDLKSPAQEGGPIATTAWKPRAQSDSTWRGHRNAFQEKLGAEIKLGFPLRQRRAMRIW